MAFDGISLAEAIDGIAESVDQDKLHVCTG